MYLPIMRSYWFLANNLDTENYFYKVSIQFSLFNKTARLLMMLEIINRFKLLRHINSVFYSKFASVICPTVAKLNDNTINEPRIF